ncbi:MAG: CHAT domain-containing tetratricopeptide repeat protein [Balneolaceae bacterium]
MYHKIKNCSLISLSACAIGRWLDVSVAKLRVSVRLKALLFLCLCISPAISFAQSDQDFAEKLEEAVQTLDNSDFEKAREQFANIHDQVCRGDENVETCFELKVHQIVVNRRLSNYSRAESKLQEAELYVEETLHSDINKLVILYVHQVFLADDKSTLEEAEPWIAKLHDITGREDVDQITLTRAFLGIGFYEDEKGNYQKAVDNYLAGIEAVENNERNTAIRDLLNQAHTNLGIAYRRSGKIEEAMDQYQKALVQTRILYGEQHFETATIYNNIGTIYYFMGDYGQAADYFIQAYRVLESELGSEHRRLGASLNNAGLSYIALGDYEKAAEYLERAQRIKEATLGADHIDTAIGYSNLASIYIDDENYSEAETNLKRSIAVREKIYSGNHPDLIPPNISIGELYKTLERFDEATDHTNTALEIIKERLGEKHPQYAKAQLLKGNILYDQEKHDDALKSFQTAVIALYEDFYLDREVKNLAEVADPIMLIESLYAMSKVYRKMNHGDRVQHLERSFMTLKTVSSIIDDLQQSYQNEASKLSLVDRNYSIYTDAIETLNLLYQETGVTAYKEEIFYYAEKSRSRIALELLQDLSARSFGGVPDSVLAEERSYNERITTLNQNVLEEQEKGLEKDEDLVSILQDSLFYTKRDLEHFTEQLESQYPAYFSLKYDQSVISLADTKRLIGKDQTLITYVVSEEDVYGLIINENTFEFIPLGDTEKLEDQINGIRELVKTRGRTDEFTDVSHDLYGKLLHPLMEHIKTESLVIVADQMLHYLPFEMLLTKRINDDNYHRMPFLIKDFEISYAPSATMLRYMKNNRPLEPKNLFAVSPFSENMTTAVEDGEVKRHMDGLNSLPLTAYETSSIAEIFKERKSWNEYLFPNRSEVWDSKEATKTRLQNEQLSQYGYIHFSTHAFINEQNPKLSGIALYPEEDNDGVVYLSDIYNLKMNADLVVLGACETGLGSIYRGEGLIGFTRAFIYAGASNMVVSMWRVSDQPTAALMIHFYEQIRNGNSYSKSLREAKLELISDPSTAAPSNWAAFVLQGR